MVASRHFSSRDAMKQFFDYIFSEMPSTSDSRVIATAAERRRAAADNPTSIVLEDVVECLNVVDVGMRSGVGTPGQVTIKIPIDEGLTMWLRMKALKSMLKTPPGMDVMRSLIRRLRLPQSVKYKVRNLYTLVKNWPDECPAP